MEITPDSIIAVVGAGTMGAGIAQVAAAAGHAVRVIDSQQVALDRGRGGVTRSLVGLVRRGSLTAEQQSAIEARIVWTTELTEARDASLAIEAIVERLDAKIELFGRLASVVSPTAVLATNTSSLSVDGMAEQVVGPERFAGVHFFNPVPAMKLVEVIAGRDSNPAMIDALLALMRRWGKRPVQVRDVPGFIVNRVARPYYAEGFAALADGIEPAVIDHALAGAGGFRMGPLALADLIGHDVNYAVARSVYEAYEGRTRFRPQPSQQALFDTGRLGRKSGLGVYDYAQDLPVPPLVDAGSPPRHVAVGHGTTLLKPLVERARQAGLTIDDVAELPPETLRIDGMSAALGDGRPLAERPDIDALIDHARDFEATPLLVVTVRIPQIGAKIAAFAALGGKTVVELPDRPGQIVLRTLAQLANAAADAVEDDVANAIGIDDAMRFGANHPEGPLGWVQRVGGRTVAEALAHIAQATNDPLYAPAPMLSEENLA